MGYTKSWQGLTQPNTAWQAAIDLTTTGDKATCIVLAPITVYRIGLVVTTALTATAIIADFDKRVTPGSDTSRVDQGVGRITAPAAAQAIGKEIYKAVSVDLNAGDEIVFAVNTSPTLGNGIPFIHYTRRDEVPANQTDMVASS